MRLLGSQGKQAAIPTTATAERYDYSADESAFVGNLMSNAAIGTPETVAAALEDVRQRTGANELMLTSMIHDFDDRFRSFELIAHSHNEGLPEG